MQNTSLSIVASSEAVTVPEVPVAAMPPGVLEDEGRLDQWLNGLAAEHEAAERRNHEFGVSDHSDRKLLSLRTRQMLAFRAMAGGKSVAAAAREAGVSRSTLFRWMKEDPNFMAALARHEQEQMTAAQEQLKAAIEPAARNIHQAVAAGHVGASIQVLRGVGLLGERQVERGKTSVRGMAGRRAGLALEARLGQLVSMLAKHPGVAGVIEDRPAQVREQSQPSDGAGSLEAGAPDAAEKLAAAPDAGETTVGEKTDDEAKRRIEQAGDNSAAAKE